MRSAHSALSRVAGQFPEAKRPEALDPTITLPTTLPDQKKCTVTSDTLCNGWKAVGAQQAGPKQISVQSNGTAQLYTWTSGKTLCQYLFRVDNDLVAPDNTENGILCYNTDSCAVRGFDFPNSPPPRRWEQMEPAGANSINCSACHTSGPVLPMKDLWKAAKGVSAKLAQTCATRGGPRWLGDLPTDWAQPDAKRRVPAPADCRGCHSAFVRGTTGNDTDSYCRDVVGPSFRLPNGSMAASGNTFTDPAECRKFALDLGCTEAQLGCTPPRRPRSAE